MKLSGKQKRALEKITGDAWYSYRPEATEAYFSFTNRGQSIPITSESKIDFDKLMFQHHWHSVTVEMWKEDFKKGLLFLDDFIGQGYPEAYVNHALEIYQDAMGYIPSKYWEELKEEE